MDFQISYLITEIHHLDVYVKFFKYQDVGK